MSGRIFWRIYLPAGENCWEFCAARNLGHPWPPPGKDTQSHRTATRRTAVASREYFHNFLRIFHEFYPTIVFIGTTCYVPYADKRFELFSYWSGCCLQRVWNLWWVPFVASGAAQVSKSFFPRACPICIGCFAHEGFITLNDKICFSQWIRDGKRHWFSVTCSRKIV